MDLLGLKHIAKRFTFYYPFTFVGSALLAAGAYLLVQAFSTNNPFAFTLSAAVLLVLSTVGIIGRMQARRLVATEIEWDTSAALIAGDRGSHHAVLAEKCRCLPFYRIHFTLSGKMTVGREALLYPYIEVPFRGGENVTVPVRIPLCGSFDARGRFLIKDVFGLTRARFGAVQKRKLPVRPAFLSERKFPNVDALDGLEEKSKLKQSDIERYFMREYMPGDRFRDINWKASGRFAQLFTRIAPVTQEKTKVLSVFFRPYWRRERETAESVAHLNYAKSWLLLFLRSVKQTHPEFQFRVFIADTDVLLEDEADIDRFGVELSSAFFRRDTPGYAGQDVAETPGEAFVFSTPYDESLSMFLARWQNSRVHTFRTALPEAGKKRHLRSMQLLQLDGAAVMAGTWVLSRDKRRKNPALPRGPGWLQEEALEIKLF